MLHKMMPIKISVVGNLGAAFPQRGKSVVSLRRQEKLKWEAKTCEEQGWESGDV